MAAQNLWGQIPSTGSIRAPILILREQAGLLGQATNNILQGDVTILKQRDYSITGGIVREYDFQVTLSIVAPALDNYRIAIVQVLHGIKIYPLTVRNLTNNTENDCGDEVSFLNAIREILSSEETHRIIQSLLAQSEAA